MKLFPFSRQLVTALAACAALLTLSACIGDDPIVRTTSGLVEGVEAKSLVSFKGIPYASAQRWAAPTAPANWKGVRKAHKFGAHCPQGASPFGEASSDENCLFLNVYTPKTKGPHPVMVWIHGGAYYLGQSDTYDPTRLVEQGTVVVTINYRLGALGFMSHAALTAEQGGSSGNYGLMDQQAALGWVQDNIKNFGGNKDNVTIFGESAGGFSVHSHIAAPGSAGLFHKAIIMSGAYALAEGAQDSLAVAQAKGNTVATAAAAILSTATGSAVPACTTAACLRALPVNVLLGAQQAAWPSGPIPSVDGAVLPQSVRARLMAGTHNRVPVIQGSTKDEWRLFVSLDEITPASPSAPYKGAPLTLANYEQAIAGTFPYLNAAPFPAGYVTGLANGPYAPANYGNNPSHALGAMGTDLLFSCNARTSSALQERFANVFAYEFADETAPSVPLGAISFARGAEHTSELAYLFNIAGKTLSADQKLVAAKMVGHWTSFARTGSPTASAADWPAWGDSDTVMTYNTNGSATLHTDAEFATAHRCGTWANTVSATTNGLVIGTVDSATMLSFKGIPYAAPPTGSLRWTPPAAPTSWAYPRLAMSYGSACPQSASLGSPSSNEDCLSLNVFTPTKPGPHPVMVWFHGGAFVGGTSAGYMPNALVAQDAVIVTVNYRLGALGFLAHPALSAEGAGASGNYGLMDQQQALRWVRDNIGYFGGNKDNVTIFGESAGGASVMSHLASTGSAGLFHKAIVMSGAYSAQTSLTTAYTGWQAVPDAGACSRTDTDAVTATCLRNMPVATLLAAQAAAYPSGPQPIADGRVLTASAGSIIAAGNHNRVPVMQGSTQDEWRYFVASSELRTGVPLNDASYLPTVTALIGHAPTAAGLVSLYPASSFGGSHSLAYGALGTDIIFACPGRNSSLELQQHTPVYAFEFRDRTAPPPLPTMGVGGPLSFSQGAAHSSELSYIFSLASRAPLNADQQVLANTMVRYWSRFARSGNPNGGVDPSWAPFTAASPIYQGLDISAAGGVAPLPASLFSPSPASIPTSHFCAAYTPS